MSKPKGAKRVTRKRRAKRVTKKSQTGTYRKVWNGTAKYTKGGLTKADLCINKHGKVVSKKKHALSKKRKGGMSWMTAVKIARKNLGTIGFVLINKGPKGKALYQEAKRIHNKN